MKIIQTIMLLSLFFGFSSVNAQSTKTDKNTSDLENKTAPVSKEIKTTQQASMLTVGEVAPPVEKKSEVQNNKNTIIDPKISTAGDKPDASAEVPHSKADPTAKQKSKSKIQQTAGDKYPEKLN